MKYIDLHTHLTGKNMLVPNPSRDRIWETFKIKIDNFFSNILDSQSSVSQIFNSGTDSNLVVSAIIALEREVFNTFLIKLIELFIDPNFIDREFINKNVANGKISPPQLVFDELRFVIASNPQNGKRVKFISNMAEYNENDLNTLHIIPSIEGGHSIYPDDKDMTEQEVEDNILEFIEGLQNGNLPRPLYLTLVHLAPNKIANHCFAIKLVKKGKFIPLGDGIKPLGMKIIEKCYDNDPKRRILIDIKHLSLKSRQQFYRHRADNGVTFPLIASHVAPAGCSWNNMPICRIRDRAHDRKVIYKKQRGLLSNTVYLPTSINLYDEDIQQVIDSNGILGVIIDQRVLGADKKDKEKEFVSKAERDLFVVNSDLKIGIDPIDDEEEDKEEFDSMTFNKPTIASSELHFRYFMNALLYFVKIGNEMGKDGWTFISFGSDFDGLINAADCCTDVSMVGSFLSKIEDNIIDLASEAQVSTNGYTAHELASMFAHTNLRRFLDTNFV